MARGKKRPAAERIEELNKKIESLVKAVEKQIESQQKGTDEQKNTNDKIRGLTEQLRYRRESDYATFVKRNPNFGALAQNRLTPTLKQGKDILSHIRTALQSIKVSKPKKAGVGVSEIGLGATTRGLIAKTGVGMAIIAGEILAKSLLNTIKKGISQGINLATTQREYILPAALFGENYSHIEKAINNSLTDGFSEYMDVDSIKQIQTGLVQTGFGARNPLLADSLAQLKLLGVDIKETTNLMSFQRDVLRSNDFKLGELTSEMAQIGQINRQGFAAVQRTVKELQPTTQRFAALFGPDRARLIQRALTRIIGSVDPAEAGNIRRALLDSFEKLEQVAPVIGFGGLDKIGRGKNVLQVSEGIKEMLIGMGEFSKTMVGGFRDDFVMGNIFGNQLARGMGPAFSLDALRNLETIKNIDVRSAEETRSLRQIASDEGVKIDYLWDRLPNVLYNNISVPISQAVSTVNSTIAGLRDDQVSMADIAASRAAREAGNQALQAQHNNSHKQSIIQGGKKNSGR